MRLSAPKNVTFVIAAALIVFGVLAHFTEIFDVDGDTAALTMAGGGILLMLGNLFKGI